VLGITKIITIVTWEKQVPSARGFKRVGMHSGHHINGIEVHKKRPRGFKKRPRGVK
jgi:hypothetical protein